MVRSCVDAWLVRYVSKCVKGHGSNAHYVLFEPDPGSGRDCLFDCITGSLKFAKPKLHSRIRARVFAATKYNGNKDEVTAILSM